ncbi:MAG: hypothetical protein SA378_01150 [Sedimentibacter sp.]|uniref:hypothetical protein n=1 Tax=Sedimentibacter sp. TaxID=1960295 RepID=UPI002980FF75|nr:hypothetical protein [Sedimentibacter sp.]MDW5298738.1 hypothetical protein [Sedimentibacter sp.]
MKNKIKKIISLTFAILFILISPIGSLIQGKSAYVHAVETTAIAQMSKYLIPIVGYYAYQIQDSKGLSDATKTAVENIASNIEELNDCADTIYKGLSVYAKARIYKYYTDLSNYDINEMLNTTFSDSEFSKYETEMITLQNKITNSEALTAADLQGLGIYQMLANYLGQKTLNPFKNDIGSLAINTINNIQYVEFYDDSLSARSTLHNYDNSDFIKLLGGSYLYKCLSGSLSQGTRTNFKPIIESKIELNSSYYLQIVTKGSYTYRVLNTFNYVLLNDENIYDGYYFLIKNSVTNSTIYSKVFTGGQSTLEFLDFIKDYLTIDITKTDYYINSLNYKVSDLFNLNQLGIVTYTPTSAFAGNYNILDLISTTIDPGATWEDTPTSAAERVIAAEGSTTSDTNIEVEEDEEGTPTIIVTPSTGISDTSNPADEGVGVDNPEGVFEPDGTGWIFRIPILGTILKVLMDLFNLIKNWFTANPTAGSVADEGIDWGNFKGFFDIFYIFYYLIIIVILILLKFLIAVFSMLSIPANSALFESYPTMLSGLNYIKNIKVGGFNITLQQIFEYMFTVFFFLFIVTVLQKLYHSFSGIERQQLRTDRDIKHDSSYVNSLNNYGNDRSTMQGLDNYVARHNDNDSVFRNEEYENINFRDLTK